MHNVKWIVFGAQVSKVGMAKEEAKAHGYRLGEIIGMGVFSHVHIGLIRKDKDPQQKLMEDRKYVSSGASKAVVYLVGGGVGWVGGSRVLLHYATMI